MYGMIFENTTSLNANIKTKSISQSTVISAYIWSINYKYHIILSNIARDSMKIKKRAV